MDRIYNNARPLYGEPDTNWVRVIYTARTVSSRLPLIAQQFEQKGFEGFVRAVDLVDQQHRRAGRLGRSPRPGRQV